MGTMIATYISFAIVFYVFFLIGAVLFLTFLNKWEIVVYIFSDCLRKILFVMINGTFIVPKCINCNNNQIVK